MTVRKYTLEGGEVAVVEVTASDSPPVRYKGRVWIRTGPSRRGANQQEELILTEKRTAHQRTFDARPCRGCSIDDLAMEMYRIVYLPAAIDPTVLKENDRALEEQMASLRLYDLPSGCPTQAAALVFGKDPLRWLPGAWIQFVRWAGTSMADAPVSAREFCGDLITVLREIEAFVPIPVQSRPVVESALRERILRDYPVVAVRELLLNAIMHRSYESNSPVRFNWYDDRIEIQSPGGLYGAASRETFPGRRIIEIRSCPKSSRLSDMSTASDEVSSERRPRCNGTETRMRSSNSNAPTCWRPSGGCHEDDCVLQ